MRESFWKKVSYIFALLPIAAIFGLTVYMANIEIKDLDLWLHLATGRFITLHNFIPKVDILSFTIAGHHWVNHEWFFQVVMYNVYNLFGVQGLHNMQVGVVLVTMLMLLFLGFNKEKLFTTSFTLFLVSFIYSQRFTLRPDIFSLLFFTIYIFVLALHIDKRWSIYVLVITQIFWSNMHGFFFFGPLFVTIGLISEFIKRHVPLPCQWNEAGRLSDEEYTRLRRILIFVILACLVNPHFVKGALYPLGIFFSISGDHSVFFKYIQELQRPILSISDFFNFDRYGQFKLLIFLSFVSFVFNRRRIDISALFFWLVFLIFSLSAARNMSYFAFAAYLVIITNTLSFSYKDLIPIRFTAKKFYYLTAAVLHLLFFILILSFAEGVATRSYFDFDTFEYKSEYRGVSKRNFAYKAVDFLVDNEIEGNFFNDFNSGAYLLGRTHPRIKVFIDGRTEAYGSEFFIEYKKIIDGDVALLKEKLKQYPITGILLNSTKQHIAPPLLKYFREQEEWKLVYFDFDAVIFLKDIDINRDVIDKFVFNFEDITVDAFDRQKLGPKRIIPYQNYYRAYTLESLDLDDAALLEAMEAVKTVPGYAEPYQLIGKIYAKRKDYLNAFEYFRIAVLLTPKDKEMRFNLALAYYDLENYKGAIEQYKTIIELWPQEMKGYFLLARSYAQDDNIDKSYKILASVIKSNPGAIVDVINIGEVFEATGNLEAAKKIFDLAASVGTHQDLIHKKYGLLHKAQGDLEQARISFERALLSSPNNEEILNLLDELKNK